MVHIVSWNVASWPTALEMIIQQHGSLESWLQRHQVDILALQEVKVLLWRAHETRGPEIVFTDKPAGDPIPARPDARQLG